MQPAKDENALVDVLDVLLRDGAVVRADVIVSIADVPLIGIKLTAAIAGMETMTEYGLFEEWDARRRRSAIARRQYAESGLPRRSPGSPVTVGGGNDEAELGEGAVGRGELEEPDREEAGRAETDREGTDREGSGRGESDET